ncbi:tyrosine-protein phosphatase [Acidihalobacter ferrooxydans]|uniref:Protein tyrosine phosphatase n=1 Tax=Acidihalobacter ferrooxydans TaxID=1765967 RepID=A0A1P8UFW8_9GAMM|nr:tyrosine-protein phosphatase [Acidihalobacter ferrooxydans]APZ42742.1 hypothetical protein BW247_06240 [Acidihalobacter ferrooxydans]
MHTPTTMRPWRRVVTHYRALVQEHGWVRLLLTHNFHAVGRQAFRSGQLPPWMLARQIRRHNLRTIVNLRGPLDTPALILEREVCAKAGVAHLDIRLCSRDTHRPALLLEIKALLETLEYPALFHCMSGADRAGFMATLYLHWVEGVPIERTRQLRFWPFWHYRYAKTGLLDHFFDCYLAATREHDISLEQWIRHGYRQEAVRGSFRSYPWLDRLVDRVLRRE